MQKITFKNNEITFNRIVAYGCSLTAGMELADEIIVPEFTKTEIDEYKNKNGIKGWMDLLQTKMPLSEVLRIENNLAWPKILADHFGVDYANRAVYGSNSDSSIYFIEQDLKTFLTPFDLILVGHSETTRYFWLDETGTPNHGCIGGVDDRWPSLVFHDEYKSLIKSPHLIYQWIKDIKYLDMLSQKLDGRILQQYCSQTYKEEVVIKNIDKPSDISNLYSIIDEDYSFNSIVEWSNPDHIHKFTHPKQKFHKMFAEHIINKLS
jgi:hypothetical protein